MQKRGEAITALQQIVYDAHEDSRKRLRDLLGDSLDPLCPDSPYPVDQYPQCLHELTLKGYFGEIFAGVIAEHFSPHSEDGWKVPAYLFRNNLEAYRQLETLDQSSASIGIIPGRTGDDCLAFKRDDTGRITNSLVCEAKCTNQHDSSLLDDAHTKISEPYLKPLDLMQLIEILKSYNDDVSNQWVNALKKLHIEKNHTNYERCDLVSYVCGLEPRRPPSRKTWIDPPTNMNDFYTGGRKLETVEIHLYDVEGIISKVYDKPQNVNNCISENQLTDFWQKVVSRLPDLEKTLLEEHCQLIGYDYTSAYISVNDITRIRDIQNIGKKIQKAFVESGLYTIPERDSNGRTKQLNLEFRVTVQGTSNDSN